MEYTIKSEALQVSIATKGAELVSVLHNGKEMLWQNQNGEWSGHAPILFPVCGHFGFIKGGKEYPMPAHGFVRKAEFKLVEQRENAVTFVLTSSEKTKELYPYDFEFFASYTVNGATLLISYTIKNISDKEMLFSCGAHESFMLDGQVNEYKLVFPQEEHFVHYPHDDDGYLTGETMDFGTGKEYLITDKDLLNDETLIFKGLKSGRVKLCKKTGEEVADIAFPGFENLLLWRPGLAEMVCVEPWLNLPDEVGNTQEFEQKDGVQRIPAYGERKFERRIEYK